MVEEQDKLVAEDADGLVLRFRPFEAKTLRVVF